MTASMRELNLSGLQRASVFTAASSRWRLENERHDPLEGVTYERASELEHRPHGRYLSPAFSGLLKKNGTTFLPALRLPAMLRRARDGSLGAVECHSGASGAALIFCPDSEDARWEEKQALRLIERCRSLTWVLLCRTKAERAFADRINLALGDNGNLRIIDISPEAEWDWEPPRPEHFAEAPWQERSLLYVLSGIDVICSLRESLSAADSLIELRVEAGLAALAGAAVVAVHDERVDPAALSELQSLVFDMPHLALRSSEAELESIELLLQQPKPAIGSLEQWLESQSPLALKKQLKAFAIHSDAARG